MYSVLIVDDEAPARELLKLKIDWRGLDCEVIATAKNGREALEQYDRYLPDLVITDIQMPIMNGLELIEAIKASNPNQIIIILSCHESFSFARKAIQLGVHDYLLKDSFETTELFNIITESFKRSNFIPQKSSYSPLTITDHETEHLLKDLVLGDLSEDASLRLVAEHQLSLNSNHFTSIYADIEIIGQDVSDPKSRLLNREQKNTILSIIRNILTDFGRGETCHDQENGFIIFFPESDLYNNEQIKEQGLILSSMIRQQITAKYHVEVTIGITFFVRGLTQLKTGYDASRQAASRKIINGYNKTYVSMNASPTGNDQYVKILNIKLNRIKEFLTLHKFDPIEKEVNDIYLQNLKGFMQYYYLKHCNWTLLSILFEFCSKNSLSFIEISGSASPWEIIMELKTVDAMCLWFIENIQKIKANFYFTDNTNYSYHVSKCIKYIEQHYENNVSLSDLSYDLDINSAYLSRLFKKETGKSLTDYLTDVRISEAKHLIENTTLKMYEIAERCGFSSTQRFFLIFKKVVGESPGDFRKK